MSGKIRKVALGTIVIWVFVVMAFAMCAQAAPKLNKKKATIDIGEKVTLTVKKAKKVSSWKSDNVAVASVSEKGVVKGIGYGTAQITVKADGKKLTAKIVVNDPRPDVSASEPFPAYKEISRKAKGRAKDVIKIALSQDGYTGSWGGGTETSYFGTKWATYNMNRHDRDYSGAWCTDFATWCLVAAKVPDVKPLFDIQNSYKPGRTIAGYFTNSMYKYQAGYKADPSGVDAFFKGYKCAGTLNSKTIRVGDIVIVFYGHHTAIVRKVYQNGDVMVVEGNAENTVRTERIISANEIYAVVRPNYNK